MKKYIINLKKDKDRYNKSILRLNNSGIKDVKRFDAINGNELIMSLEPIGYKHPFVNVSLTAQYDIYNGRKQHKELSSKGAIGCYLSHLMLWKKLVESDNERMLIFEDDIVPLDINLDVKINNLINEKDDFDILLLGHRIIDKDTTKVSENLSRCIFFFNLDSYIITKKAAQKLLKFAFPIEMQLDSYIPYYNLIDKDFKVYYSDEKLFKQERKDKSNIQEFCLSCFFLEVKDKHYNKLNHICILIGFIILVLLLKNYIFKYICQQSCRSCDK
jgi:glycosyl transferase family 25